MRTYLSGVHAGAFVTPYNEVLATTPYLAAYRSLMAGWAYTIIPRASKALAAMNCGINPTPASTSRSLALAAVYDEYEPGEGSGALPVSYK